VMGIFTRNPDRAISESATIRSKLGADTSNDSAFSVKLTPNSPTSG
jgi:hypothetical protein